MGELFKDALQMLLPMLLLQQALLMLAENVMG